MKDHWNSHRIRKSRHNTIPGRPDSLFLFPEFHGAVRNFKMEIPMTQRNYVLHHIVEEPKKNDYQEYFEYAQEHLAIEKPSNWQDALALYKTLV